MTNPLGPARARRGLLAVVLAVSALAAALLGRPSAAQDATALLEASAETMAALESLHFEITTENGTVVLYDRIELERVEGDMVLPDRLRATASGRVSIMTVGIDVIVIDEQVWVSNPLKSDEFTELEPNESQLREFLIDFDPGTVLLAAVGSVTDPVIVGPEDIAGTPTTRIDGTVDLGQVGAYVPELDPTRPPLPISVWLDEADRVVRVHLTGAVWPTEPEGIVHQLDLSAFDEPVVVEAPRG